MSGLQGASRSGPCYCGSGKKYKRCCAAYDEARQAFEASDYEKSIRCTKEALLTKPNDPTLMLLLADSYREAGQESLAVATYRRLLERHPEHVDSLIGMGIALRRMGCVQEAGECYRHALQKQPGNKRALYNNALLQQISGNLEEAVLLYKTLLLQAPQHVEALSNLGKACTDLGRTDEAMAFLRQAERLCPNDAAIQNNMGNVLLQYGDRVEAIKAYRKALALQSSYTEARHNLSFALLEVGELKEGWAYYESRLSLDGKRPFTCKEWQGESLSEKTLLIWGEQGIGDEIRFAGLYPEIIEQAKAVVIECAPKLVPLFSESFPRARVLARLDPPAAETAVADLQIAAGSIAQWLRPSLESFSRKSSYLQPGDKQKDHWRNRLEEYGRGVKIGFAWRSGDASGSRALDCTQLEQWEPVLSVSEASFICLQYDDCAEELKGLREKTGLSVLYFEDLDMYNDIGETAALMSQLDLVIATSTSVCDLAATVGTETWMIHYGYDWHMHGTNENVWYPALRPYLRGWNQTREEILREVADDLIQWLENRRGRT